MDYNTALGRVLSLTNYERLPTGAYRSARFDLERVEVLLGLLDNPHLGPVTIHIAGSKGKGSTAAMLAAALSTAGYRTGLFTSPHLHTMRERMSVDGEPIGEETFVRLVDLLWPLVDLVNSCRDEDRLTTFEVLTVLAFLHFREQEVDFQVLEVGLGGRLDATNVARSTVSIITSISHDHTEVLGETIREIAGEKAGIIKEGVPVVSAPQPPEALEVIEQVCVKQGAPLTLLGRDVTWSRGEVAVEGQEVQVEGMAPDRPFEHHLRIPLLGAHQLENAAAVITALELVRIQGHLIPYDRIYLGLAGVDWPGRLERLQQVPLVVVDGAHNPYSAARLREALRDYFAFDRLILVLGISSDKDLAGMVEELAPVTASAVTTRSRHPRSADPEALARELRARCVASRTAPSVAIALDDARQEARSQDLVLVTGSLFVVAEAREHILGIQPETYPQ